MVIFQVNSSCCREKMELIYRCFRFRLDFSLIYSRCPGYLLVIYPNFTIYRNFTGYFGTPLLEKYQGFKIPNFEKLTQL